MSEIKYRIFLILLNYICVFNLNFMYKNILLFLHLKFIINNEYIKFYLIYTNILEILNLYIEIVYTTANNISVYFLIYNMIIFFNSGLYKKEYKTIKLKLCILFTITIIVTLFICIILFPIIWKILKYFQEIFTINFMYFETKISEYYKTFINFYMFIKCCLFIFILSLLILKNYLYKHILIKLRKIYLFLIIILTLTINEIWIQLILYLFFIFYYELVLLYISFKLYYSR